VDKWQRCRTSLHEIAAGAFYVLRGDHVILTQRKNRIIGAVE
jgi:hypothetical protein